MRQAKIREFLRGVHEPTGSPASLPPSSEPGEAERLIREFSGEIEAPPGRAFEDWLKAATTVIEALLSAAKTSGEPPGWPRLDEIAHRSLAPDAKPRRRALETAIVSKLGTTSDLNTRVFLLRLLAILGSAACVPALARKLEETDPALHQYALRALESNPALQAGRALIEAFQKAESAERRTALAGALGSRREAASLSVLKWALDREKDEGAKEAIRRAMANIGAAEALDSLSLPGSASAEVLKAHLLAAERRRTWPREAAARVSFETCERALRETKKPHLLLAALRGLVLADDRMAVPYLVRALRADDEPLRLAASRLILELESAAALSELRKSLKDLPPATRTLVEERLKDITPRKRLPGELEKMPPEDRARSREALKGEER